jgi:L-alanine-DL-glutamate epimerase-like enolase superfamily enzyme
MRIKEVVVDLLKVPLAEPYTAVGKKITDYWHVLARIRTSDGIEGFGYVVLLGEALVRPLADATRELGQLLVGMSIFEAEAAWAKLNRAGDWIGPGGLLNYAMASLDIALWDAAGKATGQPLYRLLGGFRDRAPTYASDDLWYSHTLDQLATAARRHHDNGFRAMKLRIGNEATAAGEVARVQAVREATDSDTRILVDATELWDMRRALETGRALQEIGIHWFEDPIHHQDIAGFAELTSQLTAPVATRAAIIDLGRIGGITPWRRVAALAQAFNVKVSGHVLPEVHVHLVTAVPNGDLVEYVPRSVRILKEMPRIENGQLVAPDGPGLGLELDQDAVRAFTV